MSFVNNYSKIINFGSQILKSIHFQKDNRYIREDVAELNSRIFEIVKRGNINSSQFQYLRILRSKINSSFRI